jgi:hypothetical protein
LAAGQQAEAVGKGAQLQVRRWRKHRRPVPSGQLPLYSPKDEFLLAIEQLAVARLLGLTYAPVSVLIFDGCCWQW